MAVYKFRVTFEEHDEVQRDIEIKSTQTFEDLHYAIQQAIGFDGKHDASFFMSDDYWKKGKEITLEKNSDKVALMKDSKLAGFIIDPHQKIYYVYDPKGHWTFYIELIKISKDEEKGVIYPRMSKSVGDAPKQYGISNLGKVSTDFDFLEVTGIDVPEEGEEGEGITADTGGEEEEGEDEFNEFGVEGEEAHE